MCVDQDNGNSTPGTLGLLGGFLQADSLLHISAEVQTGWMVVVHVHTLQYH